MFRRSLVSQCAQGMRCFSTSSKVAGAAVRAGVVLQRDPIVTQPINGFDAIADKYFAWLEYITADRFPRDLFFKQGSSNEKSWIEQEKVRAAEWYFDPSSKPKERARNKLQVESDGSEEMPLKSAREQTVKVQPRETPADAAGDVRSLERKLERTLYLVIKDKSGQWVFPQGEVQDQEPLHEAARRNLKNACGGKISAWTVGRGPVGHHQASDYTTFFIKGHILAGQASPAKPIASDFKWVTREEVESLVSADYWKSVKDMLSSN
ncbi:hypothetical protein H4R20_004810 [Coemansia guatemalensis]|uniref:Large ribosomal subunit protein mL46 n=1 Tax=Coemansia guatemalensis TaxID=2761395 RepID=A0A9W8HR26_9FUNG|nr:hypothetical protein H4R20_004810 [Coemansia guatemalensis]